MMTSFIFLKDITIIWFRLIWVNFIKVCCILEVFRNIFSMLTSRVVFLRTQSLHFWCLFEKHYNVCKWNMTLLELKNFNKYNKKRHKNSKLLKIVNSNQCFSYSNNGQQSKSIDCCLYQGYLGCLLIKVTWEGKRYGSNELTQNIYKYSS